MLTSLCFLDLGDRALLLNTVNRNLLPSLLLIGSLMTPPELAARSIETPEAERSNEARFERIKGLMSSKLGTDQQGNLWSWDRAVSSVDVFDSEGTRVLGLEVPALRSLDVDRSWGVVGTASDGSALEFIDPKGESRTIPLNNSAAHVAWIDANTVALSTTRAAMAIEIWDIRHQELLRSFGPAKEIVPRLGAVLLRSLVLQYDSPNGRLWALDSVTGTLEAWTLDGALVRRDAVPAHRRAEIEEWLSKADSASKAKHQTHTPFYEILRLAVDADGAAWTVESCNPNRDQASLVKLTEGPIEKLTIHLSKPCCSNNFTIWNHHFVSNLNSTPESPGCVIWRELP